MINLSYRWTVMPPFFAFSLNSRLSTPFSFIDFITSLHFHLFHLFLFFMDIIFACFLLPYFWVSLFFFFAINTWHFALSRPKSVRNSCVIKVFGGVFMLSRCFMDYSVGVGVFVTGLIQISSFFSYIQDFKRIFLFIDFITFTACSLVSTLFPFHRNHLLHFFFHMYLIVNFETASPWGPGGLSRECVLRIPMRVVKGD